MPFISFSLPDRPDRVPTVALISLTLLLAVAGGSSRSDALAQVLIRTAAPIIICILASSGRFPLARAYRSIWFFLFALAALIGVQLIPMPPTMWARLPGRSGLSTAMSTLGLGQPWRPLNLVPDLGLNALFALVVPVAMLTTLSNLSLRGQRVLSPVIILLALGSAFLALLQASGSISGNPLMDSISADYGGLFANRNHQALFLSIGMASILFWGFENGANWRNQRIWLSFAGAALLGCSIIVTGSRAGLVLGALAILLSLLAGQQRNERAAALKPVLALLIGLIFAGVLLGITILVSRASSFERLLILSDENDIRLGALPVVWTLAKAYFPFGSGFGSFDAVFRAAEPLDLLGPTYLNHAHDDFLEVFLESGLGGVALIVVAISWIAKKGLYAFSGQGGRNARLGVIILALVGLASAIDYPLRTPLIMAVVVIAASWVAVPAYTGRPKRSPRDNLYASARVR